MHISSSNGIYGAAACMLAAVVMLQANCMLAGHYQVLLEGNKSCMAEGMDSQQCCGRSAALPAQQTPPKARPQSDLHALGTAHQQMPSQLPS
jgi:hypothetical protein